MSLDLLTIILKSLQSEGKFTNFLDKRIKELELELKPAICYNTTRVINRAQFYSVSSAHLIVKQEESEKQYQYFKEFWTMVNNQQLSKRQHISDTRKPGSQFFDI